MKISHSTVVLFSIPLLWSFAAKTQTISIDSMKEVLATQPADTNKVYTLITISDAYHSYYPDSSLVYARRALELAETLDYEVAIFWSFAAMNGALSVTGNYPEELDYAFKALSLSKKLNIPKATGYGNGMLADYHYNLGEFDTSLRYWRNVMKIIEQWFPDEKVVSWGNLARIYEAMNQVDSAMFYAKKTHAEIKSNQNLFKDTRRLAWESLTFTQLGNAFAGKAEYDSALFYYRMGIDLSATIYLEINLMDGYNGIAAIYKATGDLDSAVWYAKKVLSRRIAKSYPIGTLKAANLLSNVYELKNDADSTLKYLRMENALRESLFNREKIMAIQNLHYKEQEKQNEVAESELRLRNGFILYFSVGVLVALLLSMSIVLRNRRQRQLQNMRNSIADDLHDDIGSTLSSISIMSELAKVKSPEASTLLTSIGESTITMQENMSDIVWAIKSEHDRFENVLQRMSQFASEIFEVRDIELDFKSDASLSSSKLTMRQRKNVYLFFKEVINNAAKHSEANKVSVCISQKNRYVEMNISDDGKGFDTSKIFSGNGMSTLRKRGEELNGSFNIHSHHNEGTFVQLKFKI